MNEYLNRPMKQVIDEYPEVERILKEYGVDCAACNLGACLLRDVVAVHDLGPDAGREMLSAIANVMYGANRADDPAKGAASCTVPRGTGSFSLPIQKLIEEHGIIKRWADLIPRFVHSLDLHSGQDRKLVRQGVAFIRSYADKYHHAKEETILFKCFDERLEVIRVMRAEHETARDHVRAVIAAVDRRDTVTVRRHLLSYAVLLREHIRKEDEILYPWMERQLSERNTGKIVALFMKVDQAFGDLPHRQEAFIENLERQLNRTAFEDVS